MLLLQKKCVPVADNVSVAVKDICFHLLNLLRILSHSDIKSYYRCMGESSKFPKS